MIQLNSKSIDATTISHLKSIQDKIDSETGLENQVKKAISKWNNKTQGNGEIPFKEIKSKLIDMCVGIEICVYCEQNEATDIEHIYPKKLYPEKTFAWDNYVLACTKCNRDYKKDNFSIFNPINSAIEVDVTQSKLVYNKPANDDALFINQRIEDPMTFLELDLLNKSFFFTENEKLLEDSRDFKKAKYTKDLLGLNKRPSLVANRKNAAKFYSNRLNEYTDSKNAINFYELKTSIKDDWGAVDETQNFEEEKLRIMDAIKQDILSYSHPTVWKELIRQRTKLRNINTLFLQAPEALTW